MHYYVLSKNSWLCLYKGTSVTKACQVVRKNMDDVQEVNVYDGSALNATFIASYYPKEFLCSHSRNPPLDCE